MSPTMPPDASNAFQPDTAPLEKALAALKEAQQTGAMAQMPRYKCHKEVWALKIAQVINPTEPGNETDGSRIIVPADAGYAPFKVDNAYVSKHKPEAGGYYIVYTDGYKSFSPVGAFEEGYSRIS